MGILVLHPGGDGRVISRRVREGAARVRENREMVRLDEDLPLPVALADLQITPRWPELIAELEKCDFKGLLAEVRADAAANGVQTQVQVQPQAQRHAPAQGELFG